MLRKPSPLKHKEGEHLLLNEEAHAKAHGGEIPKADNKESSGLEIPTFNFEEFSKENNVTPTTFTSDKGVFYLDEANQIWTDDNGNIVDDADVPKEYIEKNKKKLEASIQDKGKKIMKPVGDDEFYLPKWERTGGGVSSNTAIQNAHAFKASKEQMQSSEEFADKSIAEFIKQHNLYINFKKQRATDPQNSISTLESSRPTAGNREAMDVFRRKKLFIEEQEKQLENLKIERDNNPLWKYLQKADKKLKGEDKTEKNLLAEAKALYLQDQQAKHMQKNVSAWVKSQDGFGLDTPASQDRENVKIEQAKKDLTERQIQNVGEVKANQDLWEGLNNEMSLLLHGGKNKKNEEVKGFNNREDYFNEKLKGVKEQLSKLGPVIKTGPLAWTEATYAKYNSILEENKELLDGYKKYQGEKAKFLTKFDELEALRDAHYQNYLNGVTKDQEFAEDGKDLLAYQNIMNRNDHILTSVGAWITASGVSIGSGIEDVAAEIVMLPQGLKNDPMFKENSLAKYAINKADQFEKFRGGQPILDAEGNYIGETKGYKDKINKFTESLHNGVRLPQQWEDCDSIEDYGAWAVNQSANFLPQLALLAAMPAASLKILSTSAAGQSLNQSRRSNYMGETDYSGWQRFTHATMAAGAEYGSERFTLGLMKTVPGIVKKRFKDGFEIGVRKTIAPKALLGTSYRVGGEMASEGAATMFGQNAADRIAFGKNVSLWKDVPESMAAGAVMERTIAIPSLARATMQPFLGNQYDSKLKGLEKEKQDVLVDLSQEGLSEKNQENLIKKLVRVQDKQDALLAKFYDNVDKMNKDEVESLIDKDIKINELNESIEDIREDDSLDDAKKETQIRKIRQEKSEFEAERNKIVEPFEKEETRQKRIEEFNKQKEIVEKKIAKFNKLKKKKGVFGEAMGGTVAEGKMKEFETAEEQREFFEKETAKENEVDRAFIQELQDLLKDPNTSRSDRIDIQNTLSVLRQRIDARKKYVKSASSQYGFIGQKKDGSFTIYLNKENATKLGGNVNVAAHEFLHSVLYQTTKGDSKLQGQLGDAVIDFIGEKKGGFTNKFIEKMEPYQGEQNFGEEVITVMSESIMDGSLKYKEGFFTKVGDIIRQNLQRLGLKDIKFDTGRDVYNFIKDYNASIEKNYDSKAIDRMMATGAQGKLLEGREGGSDIMQSSKAQSEKVQDIYAKKGADAAGEIAMEYRGMAEKIFERNLNNAPSEDIRNNLLRNKDIIIADILYSPGTETAKARTVLGLVKDFKIKKHKYKNVAAYINQFLPERAKEIFAPYGVEMAITKSQEQEGIKEKVAKIAAEKTSKLSEDSFKGHKIHEKLGQGDPRVRKLVKDYQKKVKDLAKKMPIEQVRNLKFQDVQGMGHEIIAEMMGIDADKLDLNRPGAKLPNLRKDNKKGTNEQLLAQQFMLKNTLPFKIAIPKHHTTKLVKDKTGEMVERPKEAVGIPGSILGPYFIKGKRKDNLTPFTLDKEMMDDKKFLEPVGVIDGKSFRNDQRKSQQAILNFATLLDKTMTYQAIKEQKLEEGYTLDDTKTMSDGVSEFSFSKAVRELNPDQTEIFYTKLPELGAAVNPALKDYTKVSEMKKALEEVYGKDLPTPVKTAIAKDFVGLIKKYQNVVANNQTVDEGTWTEYVADSFNQEADNIVKMLNLEIDGKKVSGASIYDNQQNIERGRRVQVVDFGNHLIKQGMSLPEVARTMAILSPMMAGSSKIGRGMFTKDKNGKLQVVEGMEGETMRYQLFESMPDFVDTFINGIDGMTPAIWKNANTKLKAQNSKAAMKDRDFDGRLAEAKEARQVIDSMMKFLNKEGNDLDVAMFMISNLSNMRAPLRRAANLQYIADSVLDMKDIGKNAEYEHMIPANYMALKIIDQYKNKGGIKNQDDFYKNYNVAIIPKTMDNVLKLQGLQSNMLPGYNFEIDPSSDRYYNFLTNGFREIVPIRDISTNELIGPKYQYSKSMADGKVLGKAIQFSRKINKPKGISVLDFDDTLATSKSQVISTAPNGTVRKLTAEQFAKEGADLLEQGWKHDFSEFNKVVDGKVASLFNKALKLQKKFGPDNMFILTARPTESAKSIQDFLKANGLNIPLKNITGLGNSTAEAKALWIADKVGDGYNDFYFADDALQNVQAVKNMLDQFDVKSKVQQAKLQFSKNASTTFNNIIEATTGVLSEKQFSDAQAKIRGARTKYKSIIPPSAQDFAGLIYNFLGKGKKGEADMAFFKKNLIDPFARGINELNASRQSAANDYKNLQKAYPQVKKIINKKIDGSTFTNDQAARVYLWDKAGFEVPGLSKRDLKTLVDHINNNSDLKSFADGVGVISKKEAGYSAPGEFWLAENITSDLLSDGAIGDARADILAEWQQNADIIFSPENLNKIEAIYGSKFREALEDMLYRMKTGRNRPAGGGRLMNMYMNWVNNSVGAIMFFNMRSALLQTISAVNFVNWSDNNPAKAAAAFANQPQYWRDFTYLFNSDYLKQRRAGNQRGINEAELSAAVAGAENKAKAAIAWLLKKGFLPTQIADSFAIASGGATFYRNRIKKYVKEGMTQEQAEKQAFLDFQETSEVAQQSARPDMISQQQASPLRRLILSFQNTPMQYARIMNKSARDLVNGRGDTKTHISKIAYYGVAQGILFGSLQSALFAALGDDEEEEFDKKKERILNQMVDSVLSGIGYGGKAISTVKNTLLEYTKQKDKGWNADHTYTILQLLGFSPPIGSKLRKVYGSIQTDQFNQGVYKKRGLTLDNPIWQAVGNVVEGITNVPLGRMSQKMLNLDNAMDSNNEWWQRVALIMGWNTWDLGIKDPDIEGIKTEIREEKKIASKEKSRIKKEEKKKEQEEANKAEIEENKKKSKKDGVCSAISRGGKRCNNSVVAGKLFCTVHEKVKQNETGKKSQCKKIKSNGKRCGMQTSSKSGYCYYHD